MFAATITSILLLIAASGANLNNRSFYEKKFFDWITKFRIELPSSGERFVHMLNNFANNDDLIELTNAKNLSYTLGHNQFSSMSYEEFKNVKLNQYHPNPEQSKFVHVATSEDTLPDSCDWISAGAVTGIKDQGNCGSCWAFSAVGALEGAYYITNKVLKSFSEQHLVSCDTYDGGCMGGWMDSAFAWTQQNGGICSELDYPYTSGTNNQNGDCITTCVVDSKVTPKSVWDVAQFDDNALASALIQQPVSIPVFADNNWQLYSSGVLDVPCNGNTVDHLVLAVGYDITSDGKRYYTAKNSWGTWWGEQGEFALS